MSNIHLNLLTSINEVLGSIIKISDFSNCAFFKILLFGHQNYTQVENTCIINATIKYLADSEGFNVHFCSGTWLNDLNVFVITCFFTVVAVEP